MEAAEVGAEIAEGLAAPILVTLVVETIAEDAFTRPLWMMGLAHGGRSEQLARAGGLSRLLAWADDVVAWVESEVSR